MVTACRIEATSLTQFKSFSLSIVKNMMNLILHAANLAEEVVFGF